MLKFILQTILSLCSIFLNIERQTSHCISTLIIVIKKAGEGSVIYGKLNLWYSLTVNLKQLNYHLTT